MSLSLPMALAALEARDTFPSASENSSSLWDTLGVHLGFLVLLQPHPVPADLSTDALRLR